MAAGQRWYPRLGSGWWSSARSAPAAADVGGAPGGGRRRGRGGRGGRGVAGGDLRPGRAHQPPLRAEAVAALAGGLPGGGVTGEEVQRVTVVGHLLGTV